MSSKTITMRLTEYEMELLNAEQKGRFDVIDRINKAKDLGLIEVDYHDIIKLLNKREESAILNQNQFGPYKPPFE